MSKIKNYYFLCMPLYSWNGDRLVWDRKMQKQWRLVVGKMEGAGIKIKFALRDLPQSKSGASLRKKEFELIKNSRGIIVLLGNTPGIYAESGYAHGLKKPMYGIRTPKLYSLGEKVRSWIESIYTRVFDTPQELISFLRQKV